MVNIWLLISATLSNNERACVNENHTFLLLTVLSNKMSCLVPKPSFEFTGFFLSANWKTHSFERNAQWISEKTVNHLSSSLNSESSSLNLRARSQKRWPPLNKGIFISSLGWTFKQCVCACVFTVKPDKSNWLSELRQRSETLQVQEDGGSWQATLLLFCEVCDSLAVPAGVVLLLIHYPPPHNERAPVFLLVELIREFSSLFFPSELFSSATGVALCEAKRWKWKQGPQ